MLFIAGVLNITWKLMSPLPPAPRLVEELYISLSNGRKNKCMINPITNGVGIPFYGFMANLYA